MSARVSAEMKMALHMVQVDGKSPYEAQAATGIHAASIYRVLKTLRKKKLKKKVDKVSA